KERKASTLPFVGFLHLRRNALLVVSFTSISDGSFSLTTSFVSITSVTSSSLPTRQTRNRFRLNHIQLQLQFQNKFSGKKNNYFLVKQFGRGNANSNNLCKLNSYRHSGLAYQKTVTRRKVWYLEPPRQKQNKLKLYVNKFIGYKDFSWAV
ncbi:hypothetical protein HID58_090739, partial [Brassica napus]